MRRRRVFMASLVLALGLCLAGEARACPSCKEAVANQPGDASRVQDGYSYSILLMMAMPLVLLGTGTFFVLRAARRGDLPEM